MASSAGETFPDIGKALRSAVLSAIMIGADDRDGPSDRSFVCDVEDTVTGECRKATVRLVIEYG